MTGTIEPSVDKAEVQLMLNGIVVEQTTTSSTGTFSFGPFYEIDKACEVIIEKPGFEFVVSKINDNRFSVKSVKLVKVEVAIFMKDEDKSGVLVALAGSGHGHRSNAQTNQEGIVSFWKLPADSYYIKPMLKEYDFEPPFVEIQVDGSQDESVEFQATRTGFSVFGNTTGLKQQVDV